MSTLNLVDVVVHDDDENVQLNVIIKLASLRNIASSTGTVP